mgnify:FL=1
MSEKAESGTVLAVCVSREKGTQKQNVGSAHFIEDFGIEATLMPENGIGR